MRYKLLSEKSVTNVFRLWMKIFCTWTRLFLKEREEPNSYTGGLGTWTKTFDHGTDCSVLNEELYRYKYGGDTGIEGLAESCKPQSVSVSVISRYSIRL